jgi:hypothetical protein
VSNVIERFGRAEKFIARLMFFLRKQVQDLRRGEVRRSICWRVDASQAVFPQRDSVIF